MNGWHIFAFFSGSLLTLCTLAFRVREYEPGEEDGFGFQDEEDTV